MLEIKGNLGKFKQNEKNSRCGNAWAVFREFWVRHMFLEERNYGGEYRETWAEII